MFIVKKVTVSKNIIGASKVQNNFGPIKLALFKSFPFLFAMAFKNNKKRHVFLL